MLESRAAARYSLVLPRDERVIFTIRAWHTSPAPTYSSPSQWWVLPWVAAARYP